MLTATDRVTLFSRSYWSIDSLYPLMLRVVNVLSPCAGSRAGYVKRNMQVMVDWSDVPEKMGFRNWQVVRIPHSDDS